METKAPKLFSFADSEKDFPISGFVPTETVSYYDESDSDDPKFLIDTEMIWSNGISVNNSFQGTTIEYTASDPLNKHLTKLEKEIAYNIKYQNHEILSDLAVNEGIIDVQFDIEI
jgi:hypothetical protein